MRNIVFLLLLISNLVRGSDTLTVDQLNRKDKARLSGISAIILAPTLLVFSNLDKQDKFGKVVYGVSSGACIISGLTSLYYSNHNKVLTYSSLFMVGACEGFHEELQFHYYKIKAKIPSLNDQFWDPSISWQNKYNHPYLPVSLTDGRHGVALLRNSFTLVAIFSFNKPKSVNQGIKKGLSMIFWYSLGKGLTHYIINK